MVKSDDRRDAILDQLADHVLANGLAASSLRPLAKAAGLSDRMLLYYFKDKSELIEASLTRVAARLTALLSAHVSAAPVSVAELDARLNDILIADALWPFMALWLEIAALAARGDAFYKSVGGQIGAGFLAWIGVQLDCPSEGERNEQALALLTRIEGRVLLRSLGLI